MTMKYRGAIGLSYLVMFFEGALDVIIVALMIPLATAFGKNLGDIALLVSLKACGTVGVLYISGKFSDRWGQKMLMLVGLACFAFFIVGFIFARAYASLVMLAVIGGLGQGLMDTPSMALLFDALKDYRSSAMSFVSVLYTGGGILTSIVAAYFIEHAFAYQWLFAVFVVLVIIIGYLIITVDYPPIKHVRLDYQESLEHRYVKIAILLLILCLVLSATFQSTMGTWIPTFVTHLNNMTDGQGLFMLSWYKFGAVSGALIFANVLRWVSIRKLMVFNPICTCLSLLITLFSSFTLVGIFGLGFFQGVYFSMCITLSGSLGGNKTGAFIGMIGTVNMLVYAVMTTLTGWFVTYIGIYELMICMIGCLVLLVIVATVFGFVYNKFTEVLS